MLHSNSKLILYSILILFLICSCSAALCSSIQLLHLCHLVVCTKLVMIFSLGINQKCNSLSSATAKWAWLKWHSLNSGPIALLRRGCFTDRHMPQKMFQVCRLLVGRHREQGMSGYHCGDVQRPFHLQIVFISYLEFQ